MFITQQALAFRPIVVSKTFAADSLDYRGAQFRQMGPLKVDVVAELVGPEIRIRGHIGTHLEARCDRCLGPVDIPVDRDFDLFYRTVRTIAREEEIEISKDELEVGFYSGDGIALADVLTEQVILSVPMKVVCRAECLGLCPVCGANRNREVCSCAAPQGQSPFAILMGDKDG